MKILVCLDNLDVILGHLIHCYEMNMTAEAKQWEDNRLEIKP